MTHLDSHLPDLQGVGEGIEPQVVVCLIDCRDGHCLEIVKRKKRKKKEQKKMKLYRSNVGFTAL